MREIMGNNYLEIHEDKSVLKIGENEIIFKEGKQSTETQKRIDKIKKQLDEDYFENIIKSSIAYKSEDFNDMDDSLRNILDIMVNYITSDSGRAIVGLALIQCCIKSIDEQQSIRLHKGNKNNVTFSWEDGIAMRPLDKKYFTPVLRRYKLLNLNADGVFLTRTLAENYPYTTLYKAKIKGAKKEWLNLVELLEEKEVNPLMALKYLLFKLNNNLKDVKEAEKKLIDKFENKFKSEEDVKLETCIEIIKTHFTKSQYSSKIFELSVH